MMYACPGEVINTSCCDITDEVIVLNGSSVSWLNPDLSFLSLVMFFTLGYTNNLLRTLSFLLFQRQQHSQNRLFKWCTKKINEEEASSDYGYNFKRECDGFEAQSHCKACFLKIASDIVRQAIVDVLGYRLGIYHFRRLYWSSVPQRISKGRGHPEALYFRTLDHRLLFFFVSPFPSGLRPCNARNLASVDFGFQSQTLEPALVEVGFYVRPPAFHKNPLEVSLLDGTMWTAIFVLWCCASYGKMETRYTILVSVDLESIKPTSLSLIVAKLGLGMKGQKLPC